MCDCPPGPEAPMVVHLQAAQLTLFVVGPFLLCLGSRMLILSW